MSNKVKYELGFIKEFGEGEAIINAAGEDYHILLLNEDAALLEDMFLNEDVEYITFDTVNEKIVFDNILKMDAENSKELEDIDYGVHEDGTAE